MIAVFLIFVGLELGMIQLSKENYELFGITLIIFINFSLTFQFVQRQIITAQSHFISSERVLQVIDLPAEK